MKPLVSVIIPVYNVEKYLRQCLDSLLKQTLKEIEIICVDDGSTDNSFNILKEYILKDKRLIVVTQKNLYAGVARNAGLKIAQADYVIFLDSDDFFEPNMLENLYKTIIKDKSDAAICGFYKYNNKTKKTKIRSIEEIYIKKSPFDPLSLGSSAFCFTNPAPWTKLFKKSIFIDNNIHFEDYICCNDLTCIVLALACCKKISVVNKAYIYYRANQDTNLTSSKNKHFKCVLYALDKIEKELKRLNLYEKFKEAFLKRAKNSLNYELSLCSSEEKDKAFKEAKNILSDNLYKILYKLLYPSKISIIIPVYNSELYLKDCLNSVINQTFKDIEIVCINDGSTDKSNGILKNYALKDKRIKIITQENKGVSSARNIGLNNVTGEYVCFLDSDDCIEPNFCEKLLKGFKDDIDLVCGGHIKLNKFNKKISPWLPNKEISNDVMNDILCFTKYRNVSQKLFKVNIIKDNGIKFAEDLHYMEDALFLVSYLFYSKNIVGIKEPLYVVRINPTSLCRNTNFAERRLKEKEIAQIRINDIIKKYDKKKHNLLKKF